VTHAVLPGGSIQAKIDIADPGDIIAVFGGTFNQDVNVNKAVRLVEVSGQEVTITGTVTFSGVTDPPPFEGFTVGSPNKGIVVNNSGPLLIRNTGSTGGFGLQVTGTSVVFVKTCNLAAIVADGSGMQVSDSTVAGNISQAGAQMQVSNTSVGGSVSQSAGKLNISKSTVGGAISSTGSALETCCFRTTVYLDVSLVSKKAWLGYSKAGAFYFTGSDAKVVVVGTEIQVVRQSENGMALQGANNSYVVVNCSIRGVLWVAAYFNNNPGNAGAGANGIHVSGSGHTALIANNYISLTVQVTPYGLPGVEGAGVKVGSAVNCRILNNIVTGGFVGIRAPFGTNARSNSYWDFRFSENREQGGVVAEDTVYVDPLFVAGSEPALQPASPCINAGINDPIFNDLDGTRNDIGPSGGCWYDPEGWTTEKPVVISYVLAPEQVLEGVDPQVIISGGKAVSQP
jgi:hypothetical protein